MVQGRTMQLGEVSELAFTYEAAKRGLKIAKPEQTERYDRIVSNDTKFWRVQVKTSHTPQTESTNRYEIRLVSGVAKKEYTDKDIDIFAIHLPLEQAWYFVPRKEVEGNFISIFPLSENCPMRIYRDYWEIFN